MNRQIKKYLEIKKKWKCNTSKFLRCPKNNSKRKADSNKYLLTSYTLKMCMDDEASIFQNMGKFSAC